jgi:hypothetical protein
MCELRRGFMGLVSTTKGALDVGQGEGAGRISASPEEGHRLIQAFLRIERADLREEVFHFVTEMLRAQEERAGQRWIL